MGCTYNGVVNSICHAVTRRQKKCNFEFNLARLKSFLLRSHLNIHLKCLAGGEVTFCRVKKAASKRDNFYEYVCRIHFKCNFNTSYRPLIINTPSKYLFTSCATSFENACVNEAFTNQLGKTLLVHICNEEILLLHVFFYVRINIYCMIKEHWSEFYFTCMNVMYGAPFETQKAFKLWICIKTINEYIKYLQ